MANLRLDKIANRQRSYLVSDILIAALAAIILVIQVVVMSGNSGPVAETVPYMAPETIYVYGTAPSPAPELNPDVTPRDAMATASTPAVQGDTGSGS